MGLRLGSAFAELGHDAKMGSCEANTPMAQEWAKARAAGASVGTFAGTAKFGESVVLATA